MNNLSVGVLVLTHNGLHHLPKLFNSLARVTVPIEILCVDTSSTDGTIEYFIKNNIIHHIISGQDFNHGATRELGRKLINTDIVVLLTQDAYLVNEGSIEKLIKPIVLGNAAVTYGKQVPRANASVFESFPRIYNYPDISQKRSIRDVDKYHIHTFFCSDSFSAYSQRALDEVGGFPTILTHEDYYVTAKLLRAGYSISYVADAIVEHSHNYGVVQEFKRYFDAGYVRAQNPWVNKIVGQAEKKGIEYAVSLVRLVIQTNVFLLPYTILLILVKWMGFRLGYFSFGLSPNICKHFSSEKKYWTSRYFKSNKVYE